MTAKSSSNRWQRKRKILRFYLYSLRQYAGAKIECGFVLVDQNDFGFTILDFRLMILKFENFADACRVRTILAQPKAGCSSSY